MFEEIRPRDTSKDEHLHSLNPTEQKARNKWIIRHKDVCQDFNGYFYKIKNGNGIGTAVYICCNECSEDYDITDYGSW